MITELPDTGDTLVIADGDVDREQTAILALRNAGYDNPIFVARNAAALISRLAKPGDEVPHPSAIFIDSMLLLECGADLMHRLAVPGESPVKVVALVSNDRERRAIEQRGYSNVHYLKRPLRP